MKKGHGRVLATGFFVILTAALVFVIWKMPGQKPAGLNSVEANRLVTDFSPFNLKIPNQPNLQAVAANVLGHIPGNNTVVSLLESRYDEAPVRYQKTTLLRSVAHQRRVTVVETGLKYPLVRVEEELFQVPGDDQPSVVRSLAMAANHAVVTVPEGVDLESLLDGSPFSILNQLSFSNTALVSFPRETDPNQFEQVLQAISDTMGNQALVEPDYLVYPSANPNDTSFRNGSLWGLSNNGQNGGIPGADISAADAWDVRSDAGSVVVGIIDTGIRGTHQDLAGNLWRNSGEVANGIDDDGNGVADDLNGFDAINNDGSPDDADGHGTHVAGTVGAVGNNGAGVTGVAWNVQLMDLRFLTSQGGFTSDAIECIDYGRLEGADILNNSWGGGGFSTSLFNAIQRAENAGIIFVVAAGNDSNNNDQLPSYPASYNLNSIISVASTTRTDAMSSFSNFGATSVDLGAPGSSILSTYFSSNTSYATLSGTSMACPHVAGAAAILKAQFPAQTAAQIKARLMDTVDQITALAGRSVTGGRINLLAALRNEAVPTPGVLSFNLSATTVVESAGDVAVIVNRGIGSDGAISVGWQTQSSGASAGSDFTARSGTLTWADGDTSDRILNIPILNDDFSEDVETFSITLSSPSGGASIGVGTIQVTILDDDQGNLNGLQFETTATDTVTDFFLSTPTPSMAAAADDTVGWVDLIVDNGKLKMLVRRYRADGSVIWQRVVDPSGTTIGAFQPKIGVGPDGELVIAYGRIISLTVFGNIQQMDIAVVRLDSNGNLLWDQDLAGDSNSIDLPEAVAIHSDGSIYVGGEYDLANVDNTYLAKVSSSNGSVIWQDTTNLGASANVADAITSLGVDSAGNVVAGGWSQGPAGFIGAVLKYQPDGTRLFAETFTAVEQQRVLSVAVNTFDEIYLGLRTFNSSTAVFNGKLIKVSPFDGSIVWQRAESIGDSLPLFLVAADPNGFVYFAEGSEQLSSDTTWSIGLYNREGEKVFENFLNALTSTSLASIASLQDGSVMLAGSFNGQAQFGTSFPNSNGNPATFLTRLSKTAPLAPGSFTFEIENYSARENSGSLDVNVLRQNGVDGSVEVNISTVDATAIAGEDYLSIADQTVAFRPGEQFATVSVSLVNDFVPEPNEIFTLRLSDPTGGATLASSAETSVVIVNEDFEFEAWLNDFFTTEELNDVSISGDLADPDGDGVNNLTEYAFVLDPVVSGPPPVTELSSLDREEGTLTLKYRRRNVSDLSFLVQQSSDRSNWSPVVPLDTEVVPFDEISEDVTVVLSVQGADQGFFRIDADRASLGLGSRSVE